MVALKILVCSCLFSTMASRLEQAMGASAAADAQQLD